jgi:hypothetical protein
MYLVVSVASSPLVVRDGYFCDSETLDFSKILRDFTPGKIELH